MASSTAVKHIFLSIELLPADCEVAVGGCYNSGSIKTLVMDCCPYRIKAVWSTLLKLGEKFLRGAIKSEIY